MFNRDAADKQVARNGRRETGHMWGTNPCSEIILRPCQFCNLSEVVVREADNLEDLKREVRVATILGTIQSTLTDFKYLRSMEDKHRRRAHLGVSLTGIMDHPVLKDNRLGSLARRDARSSRAGEQGFAELLGIPQSAAITLIKPSGTVSQLVDAARIRSSNNYYIRTVRGDNKDPLTQFLKEQGVYSEAYVMVKPDSPLCSLLPCSPQRGSDTDTNDSH